MTLPVATRFLFALLAVTPRIALADDASTDPPEATPPAAERPLALGVMSSVRLPIAHQAPFKERVYVPVGLTFAGALSRRARAGAIIEFAPAIGDGCRSCKPLYLRAAAELELRGDALPATPWASAGIGIQRLMASRDGGDYMEDASTWAPEAHLQAGFDFGKRATFGPFLYAAADAYENYATYVGQEYLAIHGWLGAGVRGTLGL